MNLSRLLVIAATLTVACGDDGTDRSAQQSYAADAPLATAGQTAAQTPPPAPDQQRPAPAPTSKEPVADQAKSTGVNPDAAVIQDFNKRVEAYLKLRKEAVKDTPPLKETKDPAKIKAAQDGLSVNIRAARTHAKQGDIFTPEIVAKFRRLLNPELKGDDGRDAKAIIKDDAPTNIPFKVNAKYPEGASVPTVPANLLVSLPTLPDPLQFRIIDKHLLLVDEDADVIVDYALNVIK